MAVHQAAEAFRLFTGLDADAGRMRRHLAELVRGENGTGGDRVA
jgi:shikimate dehydrogenase